MRVKVFKGYSAHNKHKIQNKKSKRQNQRERFFNFLFKKFIDKQDNNNAKDERSKFFSIINKDIDAKPDSKNYKYNYVDKIKKYIKGDDEVFKIVSFAVVAMAIFCFAGCANPFKECESDEDKMSGCVEKNIVRLCNLK